MALKGPTAMGMVKFMDEVDSGSVTSENYNFSIAASADEVTPKLVQGEADIAAVPANLASVLYNKTQGQVEVLAVNTLGVFVYCGERGYCSVCGRSSGEDYLRQRQRIYSGICPGNMCCLPTALIRRRM